MFVVLDIDNKIRGVSETLEEAKDKCRNLMNKDYSEYEALQYEGSLCFTVENMYKGYCVYFDITVDKKYTGVQVKPDDIIRFSSDIVILRKIDLTVYRVMRYFDASVVPEVKGCSMMEQLRAEITSHIQSKIALLPLVDSIAEVIGEEHVLKSVYVC